MRDKFNQFMQGRYGNDDLNRFLMKIILAAFVLSLFTGRIVFGGVVSLSRIFYWIALALLVYCYIRMFSRNIYKRSEENRWFLNKTSNMRGFWSNRKYTADEELPYLQMSRMWTEDQNSKRKRKDRSSLSKVSYHIRKEELKCLGISLSTNQR